MSCDAVGFFRPTLPTQAVLVETWKGARWALRAAASPSGATDTNLSGVSCVRTTMCTAVGSYGETPSKEDPLAEGWDGTAWSVQSTIIPSGAATSYFVGLSCNSAAACIAVGSYADSAGKSFTLAERYSG
jgi:hypothetical protein